MSGTNSQQTTKQALEPYLYHKMDILFVGTNPSITSWNLGHYFATPPSERPDSFWNQLYMAGFVNELYDANEADDKIFGNPINKLGLTDLVPDIATNTGRELSKNQMSKGLDIFHSILKKADIKILAFLGKNTYRYYAGLHFKDKVEYGLRSDKDEKPMLFILAFPSWSEIDIPKRIELLKELLSLKNQL